MSSKKAVELHWLQSFQRKFAECLGSGPIVSESPDFFFPDSNLGVEVVEFIRGQGKGGSPYRKCAAVRSKVIQEAQTSFEAQHRHALWVMVFWRSGSCPTRSEQKLLSQEIHRLIASRVSEKSDSWKINSAQLNTPLLETHFAGMNVRRLKTLSNGCWKGAGGGFVGNNINAFQSVLTDKNVKVVKYRKACATVWLLIVASTGQVSSKLHPEDRLANARFRTLFDRVFVYDAFKETVEELQIER